jgi:predicted SprT family Zn-dependent metalloprotease
MQISQASQLARELLIKHGFPNVKITITNAKNILGQAKEVLSKPVELRLSKHLILNNSDAEITDTILHEIAHFIAGCRSGHNWLWRNACIKIGAKPQRCADSTVVMAKAKYKVVCTECNAIIGEQHRKSSKQNKYHRNCGLKSKGKIVVIPAI